MPRKASKRQPPKSDGVASRVGDRLLAALTHEEVVQLLDVCFAAMSPEGQAEVLQHLEPDTRRTVGQILAPLPSEGDRQAPQDTPVSMAKLAQTWSDAWQSWNRVIDDAAQEDGPYMEQEHDWEPPYFNTIAFVEDLEPVAEIMRPLVQMAFEDAWSPAVEFAAAMHEAEIEIADAMPPWVEIHDGFYLEGHMTTCLLMGEWWLAVGEGQDAFGFAQRIREWETQFKYVHLQDDAFLAFFMQLSEADQRLVFEGLSAHHQTSLWQASLDNSHAAWHRLYLHGIEQYAPERYLYTLRPTIPQQWQNGLPIIEDLVAKQDYTESLAVIEECLASMLRFALRGQVWHPEKTLLFPLISDWRPGDRSLDHHKTLLDHYRQTAHGLGQADRANALDLQLKTFDHIYDWQIMFDAFNTIALPKKAQQALLQSWREHIVFQAEPDSWSLEREKGSDTWWLHWLIDSVLDPRKGPAWFQNQLAAWLSRLAGKGKTSTADFVFLRLLSKDVTEMQGIKKHPYPKFYKTVIDPKYLGASDDKSRQYYLKQYASDDVGEQVMTYWQAHMQDWVPRPENAHQSDYTYHAEWMVALRELAPSTCDALLARWRVDHKRRRNLWKALDRVGLG